MSYYDLRVWTDLPSSFMFTKCTGAVTLQDVQSQISGKNSKIANFVMVVIFLEARCSYSTESRMIIHNNMSNAIF